MRTVALPENEAGSAISLPACQHEISAPQGLKPAFLAALSGMAKAVPFQNRSMRKLLFTFFCVLSPGEPLQFLLIDFDLSAFLHLLPQIGNEKTKNLILLALHE